MGLGELLVGGVVDGASAGGGNMQTFTSQVLHITRFSTRMCYILQTVVEGAFGQKIRLYADDTVFQTHSHA